MDYDPWPSALKGRNSWIINKCRFCIKILVELSGSRKVSPGLETLISRSSTGVITFLFKYSRINDSVTDFVPRDFVQRVNISGRAFWNEIVLRLNVIWFWSEKTVFINLLCTRGIKYIEGINERRRKRKIKRDGESKTIFHNCSFEE